MPHNAQVRRENIHIILFTIYVSEAWIRCKNISYDIQALPDLPRLHK